MFILYEKKRKFFVQIDFTHTAGSGIEIKVEPVKKVPVEDKIEYNGEIIDVDNI